MIEGDIIDAIKAEQRDVIITGSLSIVHPLMAADLVDEYRLLTFPSVLGSGAQLFPPGRSMDLRCCEIRSAGVAIYARYRRGETAI